MTDRNADTEPPPTFPESEPPSTKDILAEIHQQLTRIEATVNEARNCARMAYEGSEATAGRVETLADAILALDGKVTDLRAKWTAQFSHEAQARAAGDRENRESVSALERRLDGRKGGGE